MPVLEKQLIAAGRVNASGTTSDFLRNCTVANAGAGLCDITLGDALDENECIVTIEMGTTDLTAFVTHTSDTVKRVTTRSAAPANANGDFAFGFWKVAFGNQ